MRPRVCRRRRDLYWGSSKKISQSVAVLSLATHSSLAAALHARKKNKQTGGHAASETTADTAAAAAASVSGKGAIQKLARCC